MKYFSSTLKEMISKRYDFLTTMQTGNRFLIAINEFKENDKSEEKEPFDIETDFSIRLNKALTKFNCLKLWNIEMINTEENKQIKTSDINDKESAELFNMRKSEIAKRVVTDKPLASEEKVKNFLDFRKSQQQNLIQSREKDHRKRYDDRRRKRNEHRSDQRRRHDTESDDRRNIVNISLSRNDQSNTPLQASKFTEKQASSKEIKSFEEGFEPAKSKDSEAALRKKQIQNAKYNDIRIQKDDSSNRKDKRRERKDREIGEDDSPREDQSKKISKREEKLQMEQLKENMKAKKHKGYVPKDVYAEDEEKRHKEAQLKRELKEKQEMKELEKAKQNAISRSKKRCIEDSDNSDDNQDTRHKDAHHNDIHEDKIEIKSKNDKGKYVQAESHKHSKVNFNELFGDSESEDNKDLIEKKDGDDEKDIRYKIEQKIKENRLKEEKQAPNFTDPKFLEAINKYKSKS